MKIVFASDYFYPFNPGGAEWSTFYIVKSLKRNNCQIEVITPNYGSKETEVFKGIPVKRFPLPYKVKDFRSVIKPFFQNNFLFFIRSAFFLTKYCLNKQVDVIHVQGKYLIPGAWVTGKILRIPVVVSIRDKQLLCSYGRCFFDKNRFKRCGWFEYLTSDLIWFFKNYTPKKSIKSLIYVFVSAIWTRVMNDVIAGFAKRSDRVIAISNSQKEYLLANGFEKVEVIYNSIEFPKKIKTGKRRGVLYAGKLSLGKGVYELLESIPEVLKKQKEIFLFAGGIDDKKKIEKIIKKEKIGDGVKLLGGVDHFQLQKLFAKVKLVVMPSVFPEAFGRVALEALAAGTPVVVSDRGGLPEIVSNGITGRVTDLSRAGLADSINDILSNLDKYLRNIKDQEAELTKKFEIEPVEQHIALYKRLAR